VDAGVADVPVLLQNRPVAETGAHGKALVTGLRSYARNKVSLDATRLPVDANVSATDAEVVPARRSGVTVNFNGGNKAAALIVLRNKSGSVVPPGAVATLNGQPGHHYVGYDGHLWLEGLQPMNHIAVETDAGSCAASFAYAPVSGTQVIIDPVDCT
jgi:outer membrane usher protein